VCVCVCVCVCMCVCVCVGYARVCMCVCSCAQYICSLSIGNCPHADTVPLLESLTGVFRYNPDEMGVPYDPERSAAHGEL
jgi:hypothetical protein